MASHWSLKFSQAMEIDMLLLGKTGHGKSSTGNSILDRKVFKTSGNSTSQTDEIQSAWRRYTDDGGKLHFLKVTDGPGLVDTTLTSQQDKRRALLNITNILIECPQGIHAFLVVVRKGNRFTQDDRHALSSLKEILGQDFLKKFGVVIVTGGDDLNADDDHGSFEDWCSVQIGDLKKLMLECDNRCVLFDNRTVDKAAKKQQVDKLLYAVRKIISSNNGQRYTNEHFEKNGESHKNLLKECGLTYVKEEFRKQLSILEGDVRKLTDNSSADTDEAREDLNVLLAQVEHEITFNPRLERLKKDLVDLRNFFTDVEELNKKGKTYEKVLKEAADLCKKMVTRASPPSTPDWLVWVMMGVPAVSTALSVAGGAMGPLGLGLVIAGAAVSGINTVISAATIVSIKAQMKDKY